MNKDSTNKKLKNKAPANAGASADPTAKVLRQSQLEEKLQLEKAKLQPEKAKIQSEKAKSQQVPAEESDSSAVVGDEATPHHQASSPAVTADEATPHHPASAPVVAELLNWKKEKVSELDLPECFLQKNLRLELINEIVRWQRACARQGTHKAKTRGDVSGGGKKPFRQKGTGNARQGSIRSPLNRGGGAVFGPKPRSYKYTLPSKVLQAGLKQTLSYLWNEKKVFFVEDMKSVDGKTKELNTRLQQFGLQRALLVDHEVDPLFKRALANLKAFQFLPVEGLNVRDLLRYGHLVMSKKSLAVLEQRYNNKKLGAKRK